MHWNEVIIIALAGSSQGGNREIFCPQQRPPRGQLPRSGENYKTLNQGCKMTNCPWLNNLRKLYLLNSNTARIIKHQTRTNMRIIRKLNRGQQQTTLLKVKIQPLNVAPPNNIHHQTKTRSAKMTNIVSSPNLTAQASTTRMLQSLEQVHSCLLTMFDSFHFAWGRRCLSHRTRLPTDVASEIQAISALNWKSPYSWVCGDWYAGAGLTIRFGGTSSIRGRICQLPTRRRDRVGSNFVKIKFHNRIIRDPIWGGSLLSSPQQQEQKNTIIFQTNLSPPFLQTRLWTNIL